MLIAHVGTYKVALAISTLRQSLRGVKEIIGGIWHAGFLAGVRGVTAGRWSFSAFRVDALDGRGTRKDAATFVANNVNEKPRNGIVRRRHVGDSLAGDAAAVICFPRRS